MRLLRWCDLCLWFFASTLVQATLGGSTKQQVVACNGYADATPAVVGIRQPSDRKHASRIPHHHVGKVHMHSHDGLRLEAPEGTAAERPRSLQFLQVASHSPSLDILGEAAGLDVHGKRLRFQLPQHNLAESQASQSGELWRREIPYGSCEEYHVDLSERVLFFMVPNGTDSCQFERDDVPRSSEESGNVDGQASRLVVVLVQPRVHSRQCAVRSMYFNEALAGGRDGTSSWYASANASAQAGDGDPDTPEEVLDGMGRFAKPARLLAVDALAEEPSSLTAIDGGAVVRLEDPLDHGALISETISSRTLGLGHVYMVAPKSVHIALEDLRGSRLFDRSYVTFKSGMTYVALRIGKVDDIAFPQRLVIYPCHPSLSNLETESTSWWKWW
mmetsp:Transcript_45385/g.82939  ORF Transcript_45385/g.82939 Transcript_45385/m.82939 type:complete len:388 (-) Transcript_45385:58-1221(-)